MKAGVLKVPAMYMGTGELGLIVIWSSYNIGVSLKEIYKSLIYIYVDSRGSKLYATIISTGYRDKHSGISNKNKEHDESSWS